MPSRGSAGVRRSIFTWCFFGLVEKTVNVKVIYTVDSCNADYIHIILQGISSSTVVMAYLGNS